jgi:hypothetical protein
MVLTTQLGASTRRHPIALLPLDLTDMVKVSHAAVYVAFRQRRRTHVAILNSPIADTIAATYSRGSSSCRLFH